MKISEYIAALTANGLTEDAARGLAKGQATPWTTSWSRLPSP